MMKPIAYTLISSFSALGAALPNYSHPPEARLSNATTEVRVYLPQPSTGFYQGTRFDWSGAIASLESEGHSYFSQWFERMDPHVHDFIYESAGIAAGPCTAMTGPVEEFTSALGFDDAAPGHTFVKIGVGILRKPDSAKYDSLRLYEIVDSGNWRTNEKGNAITFRQEIRDAASGYGYRYEKTVSLARDAPLLIVDHRLTNIGARPIHTDVYDHNFLSLDRQAPGQGLSVEAPFPLVPMPAPEKGLVNIDDNRIDFSATLRDEDRVYTLFQPPAAGPRAYDIRIRNTKLGAGLDIKGDRPLQRMALWSIRAVFAVEPFIEISVDPGQTTTWRYEYTFRNLSPASRP